MRARIGVLKELPELYRADLLEQACWVFGDEILDETPRTLRRKAYLLLYHARVARIQRKPEIHDNLVRTILVYQQLARLLFDLRR